MSTANISRMQSVILVQNLPDCKRHELEELCKPFGEILGTMVMGNDGFVQFVCEDQAEDAIEALDMSTFKSNVLAVRNAYWESVYVPPTKKKRVEEDMPEEVQAEGVHQEQEEDMEIG
ncbi:uncharacterized protein [Drosophila suzukii]|uniref:RRM domain-containing protein n=1 Tax=Drosophila suzukii TaxID=28584 RepID=A0AB40DIU7_DROSZ